jgi:hypothetical protein
VSAPSTTSKPHIADPYADTPRLTTASKTPEEWVADFAEGWRSPAGADAFVAHFRRLLADDVRLIQPQLPTIVGFAAFEHRFVRPIFGLIPDLHGAVERWAVRGDTLYIELTLRGRVGRRALSSSASPISTRRRCSRRSRGHRAAGRAS